MPIGLMPVSGEHGELGQLRSMGMSGTILHFSLSYGFQMIFQVTFCNFPGGSEDILKGDICAPHFSYHSFKTGSHKKLASLQGLKLREAKS